MLNGQREVSYNVFSYENPTSCIGVGEYLIDGTSAYETIWAQPKPGSDALHLVRYEKQRGVACLTVQNEGAEAAISLPIFNYGNYYAADENGQPFSITSGENERIVLTIPAATPARSVSGIMRPITGAALRRSPPPVCWGLSAMPCLARRKRRAAVTV